MEKILQRIDHFINPIWLLDLRTTLRSGRFFATFALSLSISVAVLIIALLILASEYRITPDQIGKGLFSTFFFLELFVICIFFPAFTCTSIISEKEKKTFDLLITSDMSPSRIVLGKFFAAYTYGFLFIISTMPLVMIAFLFGGISILLVALSYFILLCVGAIFILFALWASAYYKSTVRAIIGSYTMVFTYAFFFSFPLGFFLTDYLYGKELLMFFSQPLNINQIMSILISCLIYISICILPYLLTVNSLKSLHEDRTTSLKIFYFVMLLLLLTLSSFWVVSYLVSLSQKTAIRDLHIFFITADISVALILLIGSISFPLQNSVPGIAFTEKEVPFSFLYKLFYPDALKSALYIEVLGFLCFFIIYISCAALNFSTPQWIRKDSFITLPLLFWSFLAFISLSSAYFSLRFHSEKTKWAAALGLIIFLLIFIPLMYPFSMIIDNNFQASLWNLSYLSPILCTVSAVNDSASLLRDRVNLNLFSTIPIHYVGISFYLIASYFIYHKILPLHKKALKEIRQKKVVLNSLRMS